MMRLALVPALVALGVTAAGSDAKRGAPVYSAAGLVNAASNEAGVLAPNTLATLYGKDLAYATRAMTPGDIVGGALPFILPGTGLRVSVGSIAAVVYYVSPGQVNLLIPSLLGPGPADVQVSLNGVTGPAVRVELAEAAPAFFQLSPGWVVAARPDGSIVGPETPARGGETIVLYATGLGRSIPDPPYGRSPTELARLERLAELDVLLNGAAVSRESILYAGTAPGFAGLYQINLTLPAAAAPNPEIRLRLGPRISPEGLRLAVAGGE